MGRFGKPPFFSYGGSRIFLVARRENVHSFSVYESAECDDPTRIKLKLDGVRIRAERHVQIEQSVKFCSIKLHFYNKNTCLA